MTQTQLVTARDNFLTAVPELGFGLTLTATNGAATATTSKSRVMRNGTATPAGQYRGWYLGIPSANASNNERTIVSTSVSATVATFTTNAAYSQAGLSNVAGYLTRLPLSVIDGLLNDALDYMLFNQTLPLTEVTDGDMQASGVTNWTDTNATSSKVTAAANVPFGLTRALRVLNSSANGYTRSALTRTTRGQSCYIWAICRADIGTAVLTLTDASGNTIDTVSTTQEDWTFLYKQISPSSTVEEVYFRLGGSGASDDTYWAGCGFVRTGARDIYLPSTFAKHVSLRGVSYADFVLSGDESGTSVAAGRRLHRLREGARGGDYRFIDEDKGANPRAIELVGEWSQYPLWVTVRRPYSDVETLTAETDTTDADPTQHTAWAQHLLAKRYGADFGQYLNQSLEDAEKLRDEEVTELEPERPRVFWGFDIRR